MARKDQARPRVLNVRCSEYEYARFEVAARVLRWSLAEFVRDTLLERADTVIRQQKEFGPHD